MVQTSILEELTHTETSKPYSGIKDETEARAGMSLPRLDTRKVLDSSRLQAAASRTERGESELPIPHRVDFTQDEELRKNQRAKANALMDPECLPFLKLFNERKTFYIDELSEHVKQPTDWLKISLLIRADFLEALDSTVRITPEGRAAWDSLTQFRRLRVETE